MLTFDASPNYRIQNRVLLWGESKLQPQTRECNPTLCCMGSDQGPEESKIIPKGVTNAWSRNA